MNRLSLGDSLGSRSDSFNDKTTVKDNISNDGRNILGNSLDLSLKEVQPSKCIKFELHLDMKMKSG